ncbi:hypothetical protein [Posidoniimonas corsicana]|nr:hypothetical protein [Posidoniimonas corsicana]
MNFASGCEQGDQQSEVLALGWAAIDGLADEASIARLDHLIRTEHGAKEEYESILALDEGLRCFFRDATPPSP